MSYYFMGHKYLMPVEHKLNKDGSIKEMYSDVLYCHKCCKYTTHKVELVISSSGGTVDLNMLNWECIECKE